MGALIQEMIGETPSGLIVEASWDAVGKYLRDVCFSEKQKQAMERAKRKQELYSCGGDNDMANFVASVFKDPAVIAKRLEWVEKAKFNNVLRRVVNELATVYTEPARRTVSGEGDNERYQELQRRCRQHEMMRRVNRWGGLQRSLAIGSRVRKDSEDKRTPVIDVVAPDAFRAIPHPLDRGRCIGFVFDIDSAIPGDPRAHIVWTDREVFYLNAQMHVLTDSVRAHGFERMPWLLFSIEPPAGELVDTWTGEDLVAAHRAVWFENICLLKESKSATKVPILAGDMASTARAQTMDTESTIEVSDGTSMSMVDMSMDLSLFTSTAKVIYETAAANHGIPPSLLTHQGVQSAEARELMRAPLKELRREQIGYFREFEREFAQIQSMVMAVDLPELSFSTDGWSIDFGESETPLGKKEQLEIFEHERRLGLTDTVDELMRRNPDLTPTAAVDEIERHIQVETLRNELMRPMQAISGGMNEDMQDPASDAEALQ